MASFSSSRRYSLPYNTKNGRSSGGCIAGFIRRILCISSDHPSRSFDRLEAEEKDPLMGSASATPGLVARLMGLESLPLIESSKRSSSTKSVDWFRKSRSSPNVRRRKIISPYQELELEDDKFFILSFDHEDESTEFSTRSKSKSSAKKKQGMGDKCKKKSRRRENVHEWNKENQGVSKVLEKNCIASQKGFDSDRKVIDKNATNVLRPLKNSCQNSKSGEEIKKEKVMQESCAVVKFEKEGGSENSSPNSVLEFPPDPGTTSGDISRLASSRSRRTLSEELKNFSKSTKDGSGEEEKHKRTRKRNPNNTEKWDEIGKLAAREVMKLSWLANENSKNNDQLKEIGRDIASDMLDQLLCELLVNFF